jgi:hypothetical protein
MTRDRVTTARSSRSNCTSLVAKVSCSAASDVRSATTVLSGPPSGDELAPWKMSTSSGIG